MESRAIDRRTLLQAAAAAGALTTRTRLFGAPGDRDVSWLAEVNRPTVGLQSGGGGLSELLVNRQGDRITTLDQWRPKRDELRQWWLDFLGPMPAERASVPKLTVVAEDRPEGVIRQLVRYEVEPGIETEAYLLKPAKQAGKARGIAVFHSTVNYTIRQPAGLEGPPEKHFGLRHAREGCVCFCPRNYLWPTTSEPRLNAASEAKKFAERMPNTKGMGKMLYDALVAVDILAALPEVDAARLGAVGHSLGAKEALYIAAFDERIKATVSSEGGIGTRDSNWDAIWYLGPTIKEPSFKHEHHELLALVAPRPFLLVGGNSADGVNGWSFIAAANDVYELHGKPSRLGFYNHGKGHAVPPEAEARIQEWLMTYL